jgi:cyanophycinase
MAPGLGLIKDVMIDQHFAQRGRIGRLLVGIAESPQSLGVGIDEDTAIVVNEKGEFKVIGSGAVYVIDGSNITYSNVSEQHPDEILSIFNVKLFVLKSGDRFDLNTKIPCSGIKV